MASRISFIVPCRDKERHVAACARSVLAQTEPCTIYFSDQGSTDATRHILADLVAAHDTHHRVHLLDCPYTERKGMPGLNAHLNWIHGQIDGDIIIMCSADDLNHPDRAKYTLKAFEEHNPSYLNTGVQYLDADGDPQGFTQFPNQASRMLGAEETIRYQIGSSGSSAWSRDLYDKHGPLRSCEQQDMILPMMALVERGIYYVDLPLHTYISHASLENTGFQGQIKAARSDEEREQLVEINNFVHVFNWTRVFDRWRDHPIGQQVLATKISVFEALMEKITLTATAWAGVREELVMNRVQPLLMRM